MTSPQCISLTSFSDRCHVKPAVTTRHTSCVTPLGEVLRKLVLHVPPLTLPYAVLPFADHHHLTSGPLQAGCAWPRSLIFSGPCLLPHVPTTYCFTTNHCMHLSFIRQCPTQIHPLQEALLENLFYQKPDISASCSVPLA